MLARTVCFFFGVCVCVCVFYEILDVTRPAGKLLIHPVVPKMALSSRGRCGVMDQPTSQIYTQPDMKCS